MIGFENASEDRSLYWVGEAISDGLSREIRRAGGEAVDRLDRFAFRDEMGVPTLSILTLASQIKVAEDLEAGTLVTGDFTANGDTLTVRARIVDVPAARTGPWTTVTGSAKNIVALQKDLFAQLRPSLPRMQAPAGGPAASAPEDGVPQAAYEYVLKSFLEDSLDKREKLLRRALELAPDYLRAKIELALIYREGNQSQKAAQLLTNIATRDAALGAEAQNLLAEIQIEMDQSSVAESTLRRSLTWKETARAHLLLAKIAIARGDRSAAASELQRSRAMDPNDPELPELEESLGRMP